jgi:hypothetical protein
MMEIWGANTALWQTVHCSPLFLGVSAFQSSLCRTGVDGFGGQCLHTMYGRLCESALRLHVQHCCSEQGPYFVDLSL